MNNLLAFADQHRAAHPVAYAILADFLKVDTSVGQPISTTAGKRSVSHRSSSTLQMSPEDVQARARTQRMVAEQLRQDRNMAEAADQARHGLQHLQHEEHVVLLRNTYGPEMVPGVHWCEIVGGRLQWFSRDHPATIFMQLLEDERYCAPYERDRHRRRRTRCQRGKPCKVRKLWTIGTFVRAGVLFCR
jgi:hypothetical protein